MNHSPKDRSSDPSSLDSLIRDLLTRERPTLYLGSSPRWGWNDQDPGRNELLSRLRRLVPAIDQDHVPDWKPVNTLTFSPGISIFAGVPESRLEAVLEFLDAERSHTGLVVVLDDHDKPRKSHYRVDVRTHDSFDHLLRQIEKALAEGGVTPWGHTAEGRAHRDHLDRRNAQQRPDWKWDETRAVNVPEEFRHELAAGLDEHAE